MGLDVETHQCFVHSLHAREPQITLSQSRCEFLCQHHMFQLRAASVFCIIKQAIEVHTHAVK